jgi:carbon-monoxide dehydrogenase medium subunit
MIPAAFDYQAPATLEEALSLLAADPDGAKILAGGHSLIPAMKLRLAQPQLLVDIARIESLAYIREEGNQILIGVLVTFKCATKERLAAVLRTPIRLEIGRLR